MKIPDKIKIGARTYRVRYVDSDTDSDHAFDSCEDGLILGQNYEREIRVFAGGCTN